MHYNYFYHLCRGCKHHASSSFFYIVKLVLNKISLLCLLLIPLCNSQAAETISPEAFKSAFIIHLLEQVEWQEQNKFSSYDVGIVGNDLALYKQLLKVAEHKKINNKPITVSINQEINRLKKYHLLFIPTSSRHSLEKIASKTARTNTLLVTEDTNDKKNTMINLQRKNNGSYSFEVNKANITFEYLKLKQDVLFLGGTEMDLAELFKESASQLSVLKKELKEQQDALEESKKQLSISQRHYKDALTESERVRSQMRNQARLLAEKNRLIETKNVSIREKEGELLAIQNELKQASDILRSNEAILGEKLNTIASKEKQVSSLSERINKNFDILKQQKLSIEEQKFKLKQQKENIAAQGNQIQKQQWWLVTSAVVLVVFILLLMIIVYYNRERIKSNLQLVEKNQVLSKVQDELLIARDQAQAANEAKSSFLANMSHEIRTPMNAIIGMLHLTKQTNLTDKQGNYVNKIDNAANSLLEIINDILDFSKVEAGELRMEQIPFSISKVLNDLSNLLGIRIQQKGLEFVYDISSEIPTTLKGDPLRLSQILINLTNNAMKFTETGEVKIQISVNQLTEDYVQLYFKVKDTGIGISAELISSLFIPFSQADSSTTRKFGGTGLGLAICRRLVEQMNGEIVVESEPGKGSSFSFTLDFEYLNKESLHDKLDNSSQFSNTYVSLMVENTSSLNAIEKLLKAFHCNTRTFHDFDKLTLYFNTQNNTLSERECILIDFQLAQKNIDKIKQLKCKNSIKIIILLSGINEYDEHLISQINPDMTICKPVTPSTIYDVLMEVYANENKEHISKNFFRFKRQEDVEHLNNFNQSKILLVEDNKINQEVAQEILSQANIKIDVAANGQEAIDKLNNHSYDCILMDIQMPIMDGYEAARAIRKEYSFEQLPIIAMTANAMGGDKEKCLLAGMNDYVSKPIRIKEFFDTLNKWISSDKETKLTYPTVLPAENNTSSINQIDGVDLKSGIELMGDLDSYLELLMLFKEQQINFVITAKTLYKTGELEKLAKQCHDLKGVSANLFINEISTIAANLDDACRNKNIEKIENHLDSMEVKLPILFEKITQLSK